MGAWLWDLRYGLRVLRKAPGFTAVAVATLALGIGVNAAMFTIVDAVLLRPLPFPRPDRLVVINTTSPRSERLPSTYPDFLDWTGRARTFEQLSAYRTDNFNLTGRGDPERLRVALVSASFFDLLGLRPVAGRTFGEADDQRGAAPVIVVGAAFWTTRLGGHPGVVGSTLTLNRRAYTVVGVLATDPPFARDVTAYVPIRGATDDLLWDRRVSMGMTVLGRLRDGVTLRQAQAEMTGIARALAQVYPAENREKGAAVVRLREALSGDVAPALLVLLGGVAFVLLIACANVANLLLARSAVRRREFAVRSAIGAGSGRILRQVLAESALLGAAGAALGLALSMALTEIVAGELASQLPSHAVVSLDWRVLTFTAAISVAASLAFAALPAWQAAHPDVQQALRDGGRGTTGRRRVQRALVVSEIALALTLTVGAGLMVRTMWHLWQVDPGFESKGALTFALSGMPSATSDPPAVREGYARLMQNLRAVPGVEAASVALGSVPLAVHSEWPFWVAGRPHPAEQALLPWSLFYIVSDKYRPALGLTLRRGRFLAAEDHERAPRVVVIDEELARTAFPSGDPIGERLHIPVLDGEYRVVGVVGHVRHWGLDADPTGRVRSQMYLSYRQLPDSLMPVVATQSAWVVRSRLDRASAVREIARAVHDVRPDMTVFNVRGMDEIIEGSLAERRLARLLLGSFAVLALLLAAVGIHGVMSQWVSQAARDIGVRMAVGASPRAVLGGVLSNAMSITGTGIGVGAALTLALGRLLEGLVYGVDTADPLTLAGVAASLAAVGLCASLVPAWRATRVDPMVVLRSD